MSLQAVLVIALSLLIAPHIIIKFEDKVAIFYFFYLCIKSWHKVKKAWALQISVSNFL